MQPRRFRLSALARITVVVAVVGVLVPTGVAVPGAAARRLGSGAAPTAVVDRAGRAYVAWNAASGDVLLCSFPDRAGVSGCVPHVVIADGEDAGAQPPLLAASAPESITVVSNRGEITEEYSSSDGGATVSAVAGLGHGIFYDGAIGPSGRDLLDDDQAGFAVGVAAAGDPWSGGVELDNRGSRGTASSAWVGSTPVAAVSNGSGEAEVFHLGRSGDPSAHAIWIRQRLGHALELSLAAGRHGLYLLRAIGPDVGAHPYHMTISRWRDRRFARSRSLPLATAHSAAGAVALAQDRRGRLLAVWYAEPADAIRGAVSTDGGGHWTASRTLVAHSPTVVRLSLAVGPGGDGVLVYSTGVSVHLISASIPAFLRH